MSEDQTTPAEETAKEATPEGVTPEETLDPEEELLNDQADAAEEFLEGLLAALELEGEAEADLDGDQITVDITGPDLGVLIGHHGATIEALQDLARSVANHATGERAPLILDVGGYRSHRREVVQDKARRVIETVISTGVAKTLEPMEPYERKAVHDLVTETEGVWSDSDGEEPDRYVVVHPGADPEA
jgi:spoIIIJ-associated protein